MDNQKNLILAVVFSLIVLIGYDFFFNPKTKRVSQEQFENIEDSNQRPDQDIPSLDKKEKDIEGQKEKRIFFRSQRLEGSINLYGATFDDIFLKDYFKTTEKKEKINILGKENSDKPYFLRMGWASTDKSVKNARKEFTVESLKRKLFRE